MPRTLPWMRKGGSSTTITRPKKPAAMTNKPPKRARVEESRSEDSAEETAGTSSKKKTRARTHSTSPPPEPPSEIFMDEGMDRDDKYRMVEDEFLTVAQRWTVHLHAAEYKRQEKVVKARKAETINSISRPVTDRMPDHTRRRVDGVARSKSQRNAIEGLLGKEVDVGDTDSDEDGLPYVGTTLHGLMDSPRRKAASLLKIGSVKAITRAAAGFQAQSKTTSSQILASDSPLSKRNCQPDHAPQSDVSTASSDEDDDLDAPIPTPRLGAIGRAWISKVDSFSSSRPVGSSSSAIQTSGSIQRSTLIQSKAAVATIEREPPRTLSGINGRRARREQARLAKEKEEREEQKRKKLDVIPNFL